VGDAWIAEPLVHTTIRAVGPGGKGCSESIPNLGAASGLRSSTALTHAEAPSPEAERRAKHSVRTHRRPRQNPVITEA
jgi:hypothetical protein